LINTVSRRIGKDPNGSDVFTQYVITTKVLEDALAEKIVKPLAERVSLFTEYTTKYTEKTKNRTKEVIKTMEPEMLVELELEEGESTKWLS
jgi:hypothetical protein